MVATILLGLAVAVVSLFALFMWSDAHNSRGSSSSDTAATMSGHDMAAMPGMDMSGANAAAGELTSYAGAAPADADALATAHKPFPATLPAVPAGPIADVKLVLEDITVEIAPGVKYAAWAWAGGAPGPVIHVRQGQMVKITLTNNGAIPHSVDFHAARIAPTRRSATSCRANPSATRSAPTIPACSCTTAARSRC